MLVLVYLGTHAILQVTFQPQQLILRYKHLKKQAQTVGCIGGLQYLLFFDDVETAVRGHHVAEYVGNVYISN